MIKHQSIYTAVGTILDQNEHEQYWSLYLAYVSNPLTDDLSFEDFLAKTKKQPETQKKDVVKGQKVTKKFDVKKQVHKAESMLKNFVPPKKGGVD